jgi:hypothetical protein
MRARILLILPGWWHPPARRQRGVAVAISHFFILVVCGLAGIADIIGGTPSSAPSVLPGRQACSFAYLPSVSLNQS